MNMQKPVAVADGWRPKVISMFSGMEAASVASDPLGWEFLAYAEIEPAACWTLHHHYGSGRPVHLPQPVLEAPEGETEDGQKSRLKSNKANLTRIKAAEKIPAETAPEGVVNLGDISQVDWSQYRGHCDIVVGGPPCQAFSMAGNRQSLDDARGNLSLAYVRAIHAIAPVWSFTENVPGWLTTKDNAFGCFLGELVGADAPLTPPDGKKWGSAGVVDGPLHRAAWRIIDAQGFVPQRRRRVLVVAARAGSGGDPVRVLFETEAEAREHLGARTDSGPLFPDADSLPRDHQSGDQAREETAGAPVPSAEGSGDEAELTGPQAYRLHAAYSTAMLSNGKARAADPVETARTLDSCGGFAANQGGNLVLQPQQEEWIPEISTTLRARDAKGSPDSDCTQTLLAIMDPKEAAEAIAFHGRQDPVPGTVCSTVDTDGYSLCAAMTDDGSASNHAVNIDLEDGIDVKTLAFSAKDYGADAGEVAPTLRAAPHVDSHANSGSHVGIITPVSGVDAIVKRIGMLVRRLMPSECLALQGFPTDYLDRVLVRGKEMADGPRYKLCGNSWAVPVAVWVFKRLDTALKEQYQNGVRP